MTIIIIFTKRSRAHEILFHPRWTKRLNSTFPQLSRLPGEVWRDRRGDEGLHGFPMDLLEHEQDLWALGDQFALTAGVKLLNTNKNHSVVATNMQLKHQ